MFKQARLRGEKQITAEYLNRQDVHALPPPTYNWDVCKRRKLDNVIQNVIQETANFCLSSVEKRSRQIDVLMIYGFESPSLRHSKYAKPFPRVMHEH
jgi:hypothetical protein